MLCTKTVINPRTYHETICIMFKLFVNVVKVAFNLFVEVAFVNCIKPIYMVTFFLFLSRFYAPQALLRRVLAMGILSVCPSVCPSRPGTDSMPGEI